MSFFVLQIKIESYDKGVVGLVGSKLNLFKRDTIMMSFLDDDFYNFTMQNAILTTFPDAFASYKFKCRSKNKFNNSFLIKLQDKINSFEKVFLTDAEFNFVKRLNLFGEGYLNYIKNYKFDSEEVVINLDENSNLDLEINGNWAHSVLWEVRLLYSISELFFTEIDTNWSYENIKRKISEKVKILEDNNCKFIEFGTRRRRDFRTQEIVNSVVKNSPMYLGTSNVYLSSLNYKRPIGTMAHQWIMGISGLESLARANKIALTKWNDVYNGNLGIALPDTFGTDAFLEDFDSNLARVYDGIRQDSGCPFKFTDKIVNHYKSLRIDPCTKTIIFSDSLNVEKVLKIKEYCDNLGINSCYGIGTNFTNDFENSPALNIVIKLYSIAKNSNSRKTNVVKLSDEFGKATGDKDALRVAKWTFLGQSLD